jgi:hypothetical protein
MSLEFHYIEKLYKSRDKEIVVIGYTRNYIYIVVLVYAIIYLRPRLFDEK